MRANIGITEEHNQATGLILNTLLADEQLLYIKTKNFHWNVVGPSFNDFHLFFDKQAEQLEDIIDEVAERTRSLGHFTIGTMKDFLAVTHLLEHTGVSNHGLDLVQSLLDDHETIIKLLRQDITVVSETNKDTGTADFLTGIMEEHEKMAWMLRSYLS